MSAASATSLRPIRRRQLSAATSLISPSIHLLSLRPRPARPLLPRRLSPTSFSHLAGDESREEPCLAPPPSAAAAAFPRPCSPMLSGRRRRPPPCPAEVLPPLLGRPKVAARSSLDPARIGRRRVLAPETIPLRLGPCCRPPLEAREAATLSLSTSAAPLLRSAAPVPSSPR